MLDIEYLMDKNGQLKAVVIPIELWQKIIPEEVNSLNELLESVENYCLNQAMNESESTPLLNQQEALKFLEEE